MFDCPTLVIPGRDRRRRRRDRARNPSMFSAKHSGIPGSVRPASRSLLPRNDKEGGPALTAGLQPHIACSHAIPLKSNRNLPVAAGRGCDLT